MKRETITLMLNSIDDDYISEADVFDPETIQEPTERIVHMKKRIITFALAAALMLALGITAYAIVSIHQRRQQELRENLKIEENHVAGYQEFQETPTPEGTATESNEKDASVQLISTFRNGRFADVYFSISPITKEEAWDAIGWDHKNVIYVIASNSGELDDAYRRKGDEARKDLYVRFPVLPPVQVDEYLRPQGTREELLEKYYDPDSQSLMLRAQFLLDYDPVDWNKPVYLNVKIIELSSLATSMDETTEEYWERYDPVCVRDYGTVPVTISATEFLMADFREKNILVQAPSTDKVLNVLGVKIYASEVEWQVTHEDADLIYNLPRDDDEAFHRGYEQLLKWLTVYDQVLDSSALIMEDGTQIKLNPSESTPYENGVVTLYSHLGTTIDLRKVTAISILGQEIEITNPLR